MPLHTCLYLPMLTHHFLYVFLNKKENPSHHCLPYFLLKVPCLQGSLGPLSTWARWAQSWKARSSLAPWETTPPPLLRLSSELGPLARMPSEGVVS